MTAHGVGTGEAVRPVLRENVAAAQRWLDAVAQAVGQRQTADITISYLDRLLAERDAALAEVARLRAALREMVYETTSLSPEEDDGSHWCRISAAALAQARAALAAPNESAPATGDQP